MKLRGFSLKIKAFPGDFGDHQLKDGKASEAGMFDFFFFPIRINCIFCYEMTDYKVFLNCQYILEKTKTKKLALPT